MIGRKSPLASILTAMASLPSSPMPRAHAPDTRTPDFLSRDACERLFQRVQSMTRGGGTVRLELTSRWRGSVQWARNRVRLASDVHSTDLTLIRSLNGSDASVQTSRIDDAGLQDALRAAEENLRMEYETAQFPAPYIDQPMAQPVLFSEATYRFDAPSRTALVERLMAPAESAGMQTFGVFQVMADGTATIDSSGLFRYYPTTSVECAITVRDRQHHASGWAGINHYDLAKIDPADIATRALDKARASRDPVAIEPGRYTTILEPQATADLFGTLVVTGMWDAGALSRELAEMGMTAFSGQKEGWTKISERVLDPKLSFGADPMDPDGGFIPFNIGSGAPYQPVTWIDRGILRQLSYSRDYALYALGTDVALPDSGSFRLGAAPGVATSSVETMIANTERGLLVTRLSGVTVLDEKSMLCTGYTRDGLWLIERGRVSKGVKNLRFTESPLFALNNLLEVSPSRRVYHPGRAWVAPAVRVTDFSFTALADAV